ncbi:MAG: hypothetical protein Tp118SUR00d2C21406231_36 [Prokaryotic dsDNA virus sp.]|nr:MAG: hypothetical protein Tp125DCM00d2C40298531_55 [Prokaryotic dsDNA virus sp.]QDP53156.1 MAG: hypothetical protein Tp118SUR00d2C21406231_36 [Prokaryotic dsDNA virus sp.]|tara:strand:- start:22935 stop:23108 length:174 start_codon:yes stop_codon:yes gene_type:complete
MTDTEIMAMYLSKETAANTTPQGADVQAICQEVADLAGLDWRDVWAIVIDETILGAG